MDPLFSSYNFTFTVKTHLLGKILYLAYILKLTPINTKPIFNTYTNLFKYELPYKVYLQLTLLTVYHPTLNLYLTFPNLVISLLILIQTPYQIILLKMPSPLIFM